MTNRSPIALVDLKAQYNSYKPEIDQAIQTVLEHTQFIMGPEVSDFESKLSEYTGAAHTVTCSSGTDALAMMLMVDDIGAGDAVFVPAFTFTATAEVPLLLGASPVFVDVSPDDFNMSPENLERCILETLNEGKLTPKGIIVADLFGMPANYVALKKITDSYGLHIWADAAQSLGGSVNGQMVGALARMSGTSFFPAKPLGCYGDGGAVFTDDEDIAYKLRSIRAHGKGAAKYDIERIGMNSRLDTIQAAILGAKLPHFQNEISKREEISNWYDSALPNSVTTPVRRSGAKSAWAWYTIKFQGTNRDDVAEHLKSRGIPSAVYYPRPMHLQTAYLSYGKGAGSLPVSEGLCDEVLSLPIHPFLSKEDVLFIAGEISKCVAT